MKKKLLTLLLTILPIISFAEVVEINGINYELISKTKEAKVSSSQKYKGDIIIPEVVTYDGVEYHVTVIKNQAFAGHNELYSVVIPNTVKRIEGLAFQECKKLTSVNIPDSVDVIEGGMFLDCESLTSISIPKTVKRIESYAFSGSGLTSISLPDSIMDIEEETFSCCGNLTAIIIPNSVKTIGKNAFRTCENLLSISIPNTVSSIGAGAFAGCSSLTSFIIPDSVTCIATYTFGGCSSLASIIIPNSITKIEEDAFNDCASLKTITIPNTVSEIGYRTFGGCSSLETVTLGSKINKIGKYAFAWCPELRDVYCFSERVPQTESNAFEDSYIDYATLHVREKLIETYKSTSPWSSFKEIVKIVFPKYSLTYYVDGEIYNTYEIEEGEYITPEPEPTREGYTFSGWSEIPETMPANDVTVTGTFSVNKYKLTYMVDGTEYKSYDVEYGAAITPEEAPTKEGYTFSGWSDIPETMPAKDVTITGSFSAIVIEEDAGEFTTTSGSTVELSNDNNVSGEYDIPETITYEGVTYTVTSIGNAAFENNTNLTDVTIPSTITSIGESAFAGCSNLKSITVNSTTPIAFPSASGTRSGSSVFDGVDKNTCVLYVPEGCVEVYKVAPVWGEFANILVIGTSSINSVPFDSGKPQDIYSLDGRKVRTKATTVEELPRGVYIINGKKTILK